MPTGTRLRSRPLGVICAAPPPDPLAQAVSTLRTIRNGGAEFDAKHLITTLETGGCTTVRVLPRQGPVPLEYVMGQRPTA